MLIATDRLDLPADVIALIYLHRWKIELFFRLLKSVLGCRHLLSDSIEGVSIQVYAALIAVLLLAEYTGLPARRRTYELVTLYLQGWVSDAEFIREIVEPAKTSRFRKSLNRPPGASAPPAPKGGIYPRKSCSRLAIAPSQQSPTAHGPCSRRRQSLFSAEQMEGRTTLRASPESARLVSISEGKK